MTPHAKADPRHWRDVAIRCLVALGAASIVLMMVHITVDIVLRALGTPIPATIEIVASYYMPLVAFLPLAWVERNRAMIVVEVFGDFYGPRMMRWSNAATALFCAAVYAALAYMSLQEALGEFETRSYLLSVTVRVPVWPAYFILPVSYLLAAVVCVWYAGEQASGRTNAPGRERL
ncbi:TRAP transporter small permease [Microbaculum marinum]|uniref:TRAP transporter small permease protein n=1 Tax=Microbaculum marinum TaxID=1764581 RepID=A0AAW9RIP5_9HYPH